MKFTFAEKRMDSSEDLRAYATRKISKLDRFFKTEAEAFVTFSLERGRFRAEITIHNNGTYYRASELTSDMYASIDSGVAPMSAEEAILQMNLLDHEFFVFRNMDADDAIAVVYKRRQGGYGLICDDGLDAD